MLRHLPPTAVPIAPSDLSRAIAPSPQAHIQFQTALAEYLSVRTCRLASSGRTALFLLLKNLRQTADQPTRREVVIPAYTCPALAKVVLDLELQPRFVDLSPDTLAFEDEQVAASIGRQTLAVICVHPFGIPQPLENTLRLAHQVGAVVIEDAAQAMGAQIGGKPVGSIGDFGLFSLGPGKPLSTGGGGVLCTGNGRHIPLLERAWKDLPSPSATGSLWAKLRLALFTLAFHPTGWWLASQAGLNRVGDHEASWGYSQRALSATQAAVGLTLLDQLDMINKQRQENARSLISRLRGMEFVHIPPPGVTAEPIYLRLPILVPDQAQRERLFRNLWAAGIGVGRMYQHTLPDLFPNVDSAECPGANYVARSLLTLPTHHYLTPEDVRNIINIFRAET